MVTDSERVPFDLAQLLERFPSEAALVTRLLAEDDGFRTVCEDFVLARRTLEQLEAFQREVQRTKVAEYRQLVADLEREISQALQHAKAPR
jgi:hypothetical protein